MLNENDGMKLYCIIDTKYIQIEDLHSKIEGAILGGAAYIHVKIENIKGGLLLKKTLEIKKLCNKYKIPFIINDNLSLSVDCKADGVHLDTKSTNIKTARGRMGENKIIGVTILNLEDAMNAEKEGANYLGIGNLFDTKTKTDMPIVRKEDIKEIVEKTNIPVVLFGGIKAENIKQLKDTKARGVAIGSAIWENINTKEYCEKLLKELND